MSKSVTKQISKWTLLGVAVLPGLYELGYNAAKQKIVHANVTSALYSPLQTDLTGVDSGNPHYPRRYSNGSVNSKSIVTDGSDVGFYSPILPSNVAVVTNVNGNIPKNLGDGNFYSSVVTQEGWVTSSSVYQWVLDDQTNTMFVSFDNVESSSIFVWQGSLVYCLNQSKSGPVGTTISSDASLTDLQQLVLWNGYPNVSKDQVGFSGNHLVYAAQAYMATQYAVWMAGNGGKIGMAVGNNYEFVVPNPSPSNYILYAAKQLYNKAVSEYNSGTRVSNLTASLKASASAVVSASASSAQSLVNSQALSQAQLLASNSIDSVFAQSQSATSNSLAGLLASEASSVASSVATSQYASDSSSIAGSQAKITSVAGSGLSASASGIVQNSSWNNSSASLGLGGSTYDKVDLYNAQHIFYFDASVTDKTSYVAGTARSNAGSGTSSDGSWSNTTTLQDSVAKDTSAGNTINVLNMTITGANGAALPAGTKVYAAPASQIDGAALSGFPIVANGSASQVFAIPTGYRVKVVIPFSANGGTISLKYSVINKVLVNTSYSNQVLAKVSSAASFVAKVSTSVSANTYKQAYNGQAYSYEQKIWGKNTEFSDGQPLGILAQGTTSIAGGTKGNNEQDASLLKSGSVSASASSQATKTALISSSVNQSASVSLAPESYNGMWGSPDLLKRDIDPATNYKLLPDAGFNLYVLSGSTTSLVGSYSTNASGEINTYSNVKIPWGTSYKWVETKAPVGYTIPSSSAITGYVGGSTAGQYHVLSQSMTSTIYDPFINPHPAENQGTPFIKSQIYDPETNQTGFFDAGTDASFSDKMSVQVIAGSYDSLTGTTKYQATANDRIDATLNVVKADGTSTVAKSSNGTPITVSKTISIPSSQFNSLGTIKASNRVIYVKSSVDVSFNNVNVTSLTSGLGSGAKLVVTEKVTDLDNVDNVGSAISASGLDGLSATSETVLPTSASLSTTATDGRSTLGSSSTHDLYMYQNIKSNVVVSGSTFSVYDTMGATQTVTDSVPYTNLTAGKTYVVTGQLYKNGSPYLDEAGNPVTSSKTFSTTSTSSTASSLTSGSTSVSFSFDGRNLEHGDKLTVHEKITPASDTSNLLTSETSNTDSNQTVSMISPYIFNNTQINVYTDRVSHGLNFDYYMTVTKTTEKAIKDSMTTMISQFNPLLTVKDQNGNVLFSAPITMSQYDSGSDLDSPSTDANVDTTSSNKGYTKQAVFRLAGTISSTALKQYASYVAGSKVPLTFSVTSGNTSYDSSLYSTTASTGKTYGYISQDTLITDDDLNTINTSGSDSDTSSIVSSNGSTGSLDSYFPTDFDNSDESLLKIDKFSAPQVVTKGEFTDPVDIDEVYKVTSLTNYDLKAGYGYQEGFQVSYTGLNSWNASAKNESDASNNDIATQMKSDIPLSLTVSNTLLTDLDVTGANNDGTFSDSVGTALKTTNPTGTTWNSQDWSQVLGSSQKATTEATAKDASGLLTSSDVYDPNVKETTESNPVSLSYVPYKTSHIIYTGQFKKAYLSKDTNAFVRYIQDSSYEDAGRQFFTPIWANVGTTYKGFVHYGTNDQTGTRFGQNYVQFDMERTLNIYADRYLTTVQGSESSSTSSANTTATTNNATAALSIQPVFDNSKITGWTGSQSDQLAQWLKDGD